MKLVEFWYNYAVNGSGLANVGIFYIPSGGNIGYIYYDTVNNQWGLHYNSLHMLHVDILTAITEQLKTMNSRTAPPTGYYRCVGCGSLFKIQDVPYEEQAACEHDHCDGQVFCNEYKGWLYT